MAAWPASQAAVAGCHDPVAAPAPTDCPRAQAVRLPRGCLLACSAERVRAAGAEGLSMASMRVRVSALPTPLQDEALEPGPACDSVTPERESKGCCPLRRLALAAAQSTVWVRHHALSLSLKMLRRASSQRSAVGPREACDRCCSPWSQCSDGDAEGDMDSTVPQARQPAAIYRRLAGLDSTKLADRVPLRQSSALEHAGMVAYGRVALAQRWI